MSEVLARLLETGLVDGQQALLPGVLELSPAATGVMEQARTAVVLAAHLIADKVGRPVGALIRLFGLGVWSFRCEVDSSVRVLALGLVCGNLLPPMTPASTYGKRRVFVCFRFFGYVCVCGYVLASHGVCMAMYYRVCRLLAPPAPHPFGKLDLRPRAVCFLFCFRDRTMVTSWFPRCFTPRFWWTIT